MQSKFMHMALFNYPLALPLLAFSKAYPLQRTPAGSNLAHRPAPLGACVIPNDLSLMPMAAACSRGHLPCRTKAPNVCSQYHSQEARFPAEPNSMAQALSRASTVIGVAHPSRRTSALLSMSICHLATDRPRVRGNAVVSTSCALSRIL